MTFLLKKHKAICLRKHGNSLKQISDSLNISKSIVSLWCKEIELTELQKHNLIQRRIKLSLKTLSIINTKKKEALQKQEKQILDIAKLDTGLTLSKRDLLLIGLALYWGEGYKKGNNELGFTNSDPLIINFVIKWFKEVYNVKNTDFTLRVSINKIHESRIKDVEKKWATITNIPINQFTKTSLIKSIQKKVYKNMNTHIGTLRIKVKKGSILRKRILASIGQLATVPYTK